MPAWHGRMCKVDEHPHRHRAVVQPTSGHMWSTGACGACVGGRAGGPTHTCRRSMVKAMRSGLRTRRATGPSMNLSRPKRSTAGAAGGAGHGLEEEEEEEGPKGDAPCQEHEGRCTAALLQSHTCDVHHHFVTMLGGGGYCKAKHRPPPTSPQTTNPAHILHPTPGDYRPARPLGLLPPARLTKRYAVQRKRLLQRGQAGGRPGPTGRA